MASRENVLLDLGCAAADRVDHRVAISGFGATLHRRLFRPDAQLRSRAAGAYVFAGPAPNTYRPNLVPHTIAGPLAIGPIDIVPFEQDHGPGGTTLGFRFGPLAYSTDVKTMPEAAFDALAGIDTWIVDCVGERPHITHSHVEQTLQWIDRVKPRQAFLTHMSHHLDYASLAARLPPGVAPAHDGLTIELPTP